MCMEDYVQATLREIAAHINPHVGRNDVSTKKDPVQITEDIVNLAIKLKRKCDDVRNDHQRNAADVNRKEVKRKFSRKIFTVLKPW